MRFNWHSQTLGKVFVPGPARVGLYSGLLALGVCCYCLFAVILTRGGVPEDMLWGPYGIFPLSSLCLSFPSIFCMRLAGHDPGGYSSDGDLLLIFVLNLFFYTLIFFALLNWRQSFKRRTYAKVEKGEITGAQADRTRSLSRRHLLEGVGGGLLAVGLGGLYLRKDVDNIELVRLPMPLKDLPEELVGLTIVQLSDLHRGPFVSHEYLKRVVDMVNALNPDIVAMSGDYVYVSGRYYAEAAKIMALFRPRIAMVGTLGNHDHWHGVAQGIHHFKQAGMLMLDNTRVFITPERTLSMEPPARGLCLGGLGDSWEDVCSYAAAFANVPQDMPRVVIAHNPDAAQIKEAGAQRVDFMLAGHTHGGQVLLPLVGPMAVPITCGERFLKGLAQGNYFPVYVNRGIGMTVMPIRCGSRPEITLFRLERG